MDDKAVTESTCLRCGRCCYAKVIIDDQVYYTDIPCEYLDTTDNSCTIYAVRFEKNPDCLSVSEGMRAGVFPADCPYVRDVPGYRAPHTDCDLAEMARIYREDT